MFLLLPNLISYICILLFLERFCHEGLITCMNRQRAQSEARINDLKPKSFKESTCKSDLTLRWYFPFEELSDEWGGLSSVNKVTPVEKYHHAIIWYKCTKACAQPDARPLAPTCLQVAYVSINRIFFHLPQALTKIGNTERKTEFFTCRSVLL